MEDRLIVIYHVGTSVPNVLESELYPLVDEIKARAYGDVILAFGSLRAVKKLKEKGYEVPWIQSLFEGDLAYKTIILLPLHLVGGLDLKKTWQQLLASGTRREGSKASWLYMVPPILSSERWRHEVVKQIRLELKDQDQVLFACHGTKDPSKAFYEAFTEDYKRGQSDAYLIGLGEDLRGLDPLPKSLALFPLFTISGYHVMQDLYLKEDALYKTLLRAGVSVKLYDQGLLAKEAYRLIYINMLAGYLEDNHLV